VASIVARVARLCNDREGRFGRDEITGLAVAGVLNAPSIRRMGEQEMEKCTELKA
jgi:hypothetical protein